MHKVELLAPAGSMESLTAALAAGADAVYIGGNRFGARAYADNLDQDEMLRAIDYVHLHGAKIYLTVNTLLKEAELAELYQYLSPYYQCGLDGVIVQDFGVLAFVRRNFADLPIHASTQMTVTSHHGAKLLRELGVERIVPARELSLAEIAQIHQKVDIEIESFVHGALCYGYSGQCLMSSLIGGRSGNRGRCAQPCRLNYDLKQEGQALNKKEEQYLLSLKDLCTLELIPDIIEAGVCSLKIEGRMKSPRYTAGVVSIYRKYLDLYLDKGRQYYQVDPIDKEKLLDLFDRGGFTDGFYQRKPDRSMVSLKAKPAFRKGNEALHQYLDETYILNNQQIKIYGSVTIEPEKPICFTLSQDGGARVTIQGSIPDYAVKQPITSDQVRKQLNKTGGSPFYFDKLDINLQGKLFIPVQLLNELRRDGLHALSKQILNRFQRQPEHQVKAVELDKPISMEVGYSSLHVSVETLVGLETIIAHADVSEIYLDSTGVPCEEWVNAVDHCHQAPVPKKCFLMFPQIFRAEAEQYFIKQLAALVGAGFDGFVVRNLEEVAFLRAYKIDLPLIFDYTIYALNHEARALLLRQKASRLTLPVELNSKELQHLTCEHLEMIIYGYLPMMVSASCLVKNVSGCNKKPVLTYLKDRKGKEMAVKNHCIFCYNSIYNSSPLSLLGQHEEIRKLNPASLRMSFTVESAQEIGRLLDAYADTFLHQKSNALELQDFTKGHFKRGVE